MPKHRHAFPYLQLCCDVGSRWLRTALDNPRTAVDAKTLQYVAKPRSRNNIAPIAERALAALGTEADPQVDLFDEPFASLDQHLRERLREEVRDIQRRAGITMIFVTHGQDEALAIADRIAVMRDGRLEQLSRPDTLYRQPQTEFVAGFVGQMNLLRGAVRTNVMSAAGIDLPTVLSDGPATLARRPEDIVLNRRNDEGGATVTRVTDFGTHLSIEVETICGHRLKVMTPPDTGWSADMRADVSARKFALYRQGRLCFMPSSASSAAAHIGAGSFSGSRHDTLLH